MTMTSGQEAAVIAMAEEMGEAGELRYDGAVDWDEVASRIEKALDVDLPTQWTDPLLARLKRVYRKAYSEANE